MSIIVDANCVAATFCSTPSNDFLPILVALNDGTVKLIVGGELKKEYQKVGTAWRFLLKLDQAGRAHMVDDAEVEAETTRVAAEIKLKSDDPHVIALALVSGARILCSHDEALHQDFKNVDILRPKGKVYQCAAHAKLLKQCRS